MAANALAPCIPKSSAATWYLQINGYRYILFVFHEEGFQLPIQSKCQEMREMQTNLKFLSNHLARNMLTHLSLDPSATYMHA